MEASACLILLLSVTGWANRGKKISATMDAWKGHHQAELIRSWGPPDETDPDGKGGQVLTWLLDRGGSTTTATTLKVDSDICPQCSDVTVYRERTRQAASRMFWVDKEGIIYFWRWRGY